MLSKEKKDEVRAFLKESPHISLQNVALLYDVTYPQVYALNREVHGVKPRVKKKPAVKAKSKMGRKAILKTAGDKFKQSVLAASDVSMAMATQIKELTAKIDSEP